MASSDAPSACTFKPATFESTGCKDTGAIKGFEGIAPVSADCPTTCNAEANCVVERSFAGLAKALNLSAYAEDPDEQTQLTKEDYDNAYRYAIRRLCLEFGFRLGRDMAACSRDDCFGSEEGSIGDRYTNFCGFTERQCSVAGTSTVDKGESCLYGVYDFGGGGKCMERSWGSIAGAFGSVLGVAGAANPAVGFAAGELTSKMVDKYVTNRFHGLSPAQVVHSTDGPEWCSAISQQGASVQHHPCDKGGGPCIGGSRLRDLCRVSPWCDFKGVCSRGPGAAGGEPCDDDADCRVCVGTGLPCADDGGCPATSATLPEVPGGFGVTATSCHKVDSRATLEVQHAPPTRTCAGSRVRACASRADCAYDADNGACDPGIDGSSDCKVPDGMTCTGACPPLTERRSFCEESLTDCSRTTDCKGANERCLRDQCVGVPPHCGAGYEATHADGATGLPCRAGSGGACRGWCASCAVPGVCASDRTCDLTGAECKARQTPRAAYSILKSTAMTSGPVVRRRYPNAPSPETCTNTTNPFQGTTEWDGGQCYLVGQVDGGPNTEVDVPAVGGATYGSGQYSGQGDSTDCDEVGGRFDVSTVQCMMPPVPTVTHECVYPYGLSDGSAARQDLSQAVSANALTEAQYAEAVAQCRQVGGEFRYGRGCRVPMPVLKPSDLWRAHGEGGDEAVHRLVTKNRVDCEYKGGTYKTYNVPYSEWRLVYRDDDQHTQHDCSPTSPIPRMRCEIPSTNVTSSGDPVAGMFDAPAWIYNAYGTDPALRNDETPAPPSPVAALASDSYDAPVTDLGVSSTTWLQDAFDLSWPDTQASGEGDVRAEWAKPKDGMKNRADWMCHATRAYCNQKEVDFGNNPLAAGDKGGCHINAAQAFFENIFGKTLVRNFRRDVVENSESAFKSCSGNRSGAGHQILGGMCAGGAALAGGVEWLGDGLNDLGKTIESGAKKFIHLFGSDRRLKDVIVPIAADVLGPDVHLYLYRWNDRAKALRVALGDGLTIGFLAQEVRTVLPDRVVAGGPGGYLRIVVPTAEEAKGDRRLALLRLFIYNGPALARAIEAAHARGGRGSGVRRPSKHAGGARLTRPSARSSPT